MGPTIRPVWSLAFLCALVCASASFSEEGGCRHRDFCELGFYEPGAADSLDSVLAEFDDLLAEGRYHEVYEALVDRYARTSDLDDLGSRFLDGLESFQQQTAREGSCPITFFTPGAAANDFIGDSCVLFSHEAFEIDVDAGCRTHPERIQRIGYFADALSGLCRMETAPARRQVEAAVRHTRDRWDAFLFEGLPMYPWEALLNSYWLVSEEIQDVPTHQWLVLHPGVGYELTTDGFEEMRGQAAVSVELGHIWYLNSVTYARWWGLGLLATFRDDVGAGAGIVGHYNDFTLGITWHDFDEDGDQFDDSPTLYVSVELYQLLNRGSRRWERLKEADLERQLGNLLREGDRASPSD